MAIPFSELSKVNPSSIIELFELDLEVGVHIPAGNPNNLATNFAFHAGARLETMAAIKFRGKTYQRLPVEATGFEQRSTGVSARPTITFSNLGGIDKDGVVMTMSDFLNIVNTVTPANDLLNAKLTRKLPLASALDNDNFVAGTNPYGTPSDNRLKDEIFFIDRKALESRTVVQFELVSRLDMENKRVPARIVTRDIFPSAGNFY